MQKFFSFLIFFIFLCFEGKSQFYPVKKIVDSEDAIVGASRLELYLPILKDKRVGVIANQTSIFNNTHLIDTLISQNIDIKKIFTPEHGFRGTADEGAIINNSIDEKTQLPIISLYGKNKKSQGCTANILQEKTARYSGGCFLSISLQRKAIFSSEPPKI